MLTRVLFLLVCKFYAMHASLVGSGFFGVDGRADCVKHVISLGDSHVEREAVRALCKNVPSTHTKSVKFSERPTAEQLRRQLELVVQCFGYITTHSGDLDLQLTVTMGDAPRNTAPAAPAAPAHTPAAPAVDPAPSPSVSASSLLSSEEVKQSNSPTSQSSKKLQLDSGYAPMVVEA